MGPDLASSMPPQTPDREAYSKRAAGRSGLPGRSKTGTRAPRAIGFGALALVAALLSLPPSALAVVRTCTTDAVSNTQNVLCASPSGPCTGTAVTVSDDLQVTNMGCEFNLNGCVGGTNVGKACAVASQCPGSTCSPRAVTFNRQFDMAGGSGFIKVINATNITIGATGKLKARGDFVKRLAFRCVGGTNAECQSAPSTRSAPGEPASKFSCPKTVV